MKNEINNLFETSGDFKVKPKKMYTEYRSLIDTHEDPTLSSKNESKNTKGRQSPRNRERKGTRRLDDEL